jgi:NAD+ kinase
VLGVACGSLGALSAVSADDIELALDRAAAGTWPPRRLPALEITSDAGAHEWAINDFVVSRRGSGQLLADVSLDGELYVRLAGDGVIVASTLGSSAYTMAAGGPILAPGTDAFVVTPLAMHGGSAPPLVVPAAGVVTVQTQPGFSGHATDTDGHERTIPGDRFEVRLRPDKALLVAPTGLRRRKLIIDSPRVLARDERERR